MAKTANLYVRIEPDVKVQAEDILNTLGIPASSAINMFYKQIILQKGIPFDVKLPQHSVTNMHSLSEEQMNKEIETGYNQMMSGETISVADAFANIRENYDI